MLDPRDPKSFLVFSILNERSKDEVLAKSGCGFLILAFALLVACGLAFSIR